MSNVVSFGLENWSFPAQCSRVRLDCYTIFDDLTPLSSCDGDEHHKAEYVSTCIELSLSMTVSDFFQLHRDSRLGHPIGSFMAEDSPYLWILDGLESDFPHLRVWTYGYGGSLM